MVVLDRGCRFYVNFWGEVLASAKVRNSCGNGVLDPGEACDGQQFGGKTCESYGLGSGTLVCNDSCHVVLSGCTPAELCVNGKDDASDGDTDCDDSDCATHSACTDPRTFVKPLLWSQGQLWGASRPRPSDKGGCSGPTEGCGPLEHRVGRLALPAARSVFAGYSI